MSRPEHFQTRYHGRRAGRQSCWRHIWRRGPDAGLPWSSGNGSESSCPAVASPPAPGKNEDLECGVVYLASPCLGIRRRERRHSRSTCPGQEARSGAMVDREVAFHLVPTRGVRPELIMGTGRFVAPKTIEVQLKRWRQAPTWSKAIGSC